MSATEYDVNLRDIFFVLFEQLKVQDICKFEKFKDFGEEDFKMILEQAADFAKGALAPANRPGDEEGCKYEDGKVMVPKAFKGLYDQYAKGGWIGMAGEPEYGGQ